MIETSFWIRFVLAILATWRITHLLSSEDGPADLITTFRRRLGNGIAGKLMDCFKCLSLWVAMPMSFFVGGSPPQLLLIWLAISGAACLIDRAGQEPVIIRQIPEEERGGLDDGMLWSEQGVSQGQSVASHNAASR
jgi:hypothetical protein